MKQKIKPGIITNEELIESRDAAIELSIQAKQKLRGMIPLRYDNKTVIYIKPDKDKDEQLHHFNEKLERSRNNNY